MIKRFSFIPRTMFGRLFGLVFLSVTASHISFFLMLASNPPSPRLHSPPSPPPIFEFFSERRPPPPSLKAVEWPDPRNDFWIGLLIQFIVVIWASRVGSRMMVSPIEELAEAAAHLSNNVNAPPIDETGPIEARMAIRVFNNMQQKLSEQLEARTRFLAAVSHDLRTPLTRIRLRSEQIKDVNVAEKLQKDVREMSEMIDATLSFLRDEYTHESRQSIDVREMLQAIVSDTEGYNKKVVIHGDCAPIDGMKSWLTRAFQNLIDNGVRYGERVVINIEDSQEELRILMRDYGPGIPEEDLSHVLEPFVRLDKSRNRNTGGVGLGLNISFDAITRHGGTLSLQNNPDIGLCACIVIPRNENFVSHDNE